MSDRIEAIRARWEAATPGTWEAGDTWVYTMPVYPDDNRLSNIFGMKYADEERREVERARSQANCEAVAHAPEDVAWLLSEVERLRALVGHLALEHAETIDGEWGCCHSKTEIRTGDVPPAFEGDDASILTAEQCPGRESYLKDVARAALAPVAPDAEPTEWEWSEGDVVVTDDAVWTRVKGGINYPWRSVTGSDQRDQDITDLVTKHGGRVLVCKARGIGGAS